MRKQICIPSNTGCSLKVYRFASAPFKVFSQGAPSKYLKIFVATHGGRAFNETVLIIRGGGGFGGGGPCLQGL